MVNTSYVPLLFPKAAGDGVYDRLQAACLEGGTSFYTSGIDPGFGNAGITVHALALCKEVRTVRMLEIVNYATWDNPFTMFEIMGFGKDDPSQSLLLSPGSISLAWGPVLHLVASAIGLQLDSVEETHEILRADEDITIASGTVEQGDDLRHALRDHRHGRRRGAHRRRARHPPARRATRPTGPRAAATGSSSRASRT